MDQVNVIVYLVFGSILGLQVSKVSVVDQVGNLLIDGIGVGEVVFVVICKCDQIFKDIQDKICVSVVNVLDLLVGSRNYCVSVMLDFDFSIIDEIQEYYGDVLKINCEESVLDSDINQVVMGVFGFFSNCLLVVVNQMINGMEENCLLEVLFKYSESKCDYFYDCSVQYIQYFGFVVKCFNVVVVFN